MKLDCKHNMPSPCGGLPATLHLQCQRKVIVMYN